MPRPISWLSRLHEIRRTVAGSARSHYERREIEALFQVQPRAAQLLLEVLPTMSIGRSRLVERQALADFVERIHQADDPSAELEALRSQSKLASYKKPRTLVRRDVEPIPVDSLPGNIEFSRGEMKVSFRTIEDLVQAMYSLARAIETDGDELARRYEVRDTPEDGSPTRSEFELILQDDSNLDPTRRNGAIPLQHPVAS